MDSKGGNGEQGEKGSRRRTISGDRPVIEKPERRIYVRETDAPRPPRNDSNPVATPPADQTREGRPAMPSSPAGRKRSGSGSFLSRLNFLRSTGGEDGARPSSRAGKDATSPTKSMFGRKAMEEGHPQEQRAASPQTEGEGALSAALQQSKTRKRKGSLRKTALLGGRRNVTEEGGEREGSFPLPQRPPDIKPVDQRATQDRSVQDIPSRPSVDDDTRSSEELDPAPQRSIYEIETAASSTGSSLLAEPAAVSAARLSLLTHHHHNGLANGVPRQRMVDDLGSPVDIKSPTTSQASFTSTTTTTSDDDILTFDRSAKSLPLPTTTKPISPPSYFPINTSTTTTSLSSRSLASKRRSPLSRTLPLTSNTFSPPASSEPHDYTETATWGYIILACTWLTFTVGMGSCLGLWSWAWDVGETPYAPPELEDDPTLPIVGYYPALMVLTGVVAWVWITVAWVGMKYFRHAKIEV